ncbi:EndoU domain-containing protein [Bacillus pseudomycoides]|uniref:EndoU domain-containing protein n=1 Tax=Bacillus pseudomycoides TaxID=64104 RepID=UPI000BF1591B|nr:EndoU domain-containing protein [Bacillus pseudomycoides]PEI90959.1 hypothetical protein CN686_23240 [Bacillus pseudomycoides]PEM74379.1 hypothetical protein CN619_13170 [Bacillus pseudomycoides]PGA60494.1 hypothetical protein COL84_21605 [Bacillus pseudomycoides]PHA47901.1 hypothetical protein COE73_18050 [Bacillus pseudomycoides]PHA52262.1 hypothetical protein COE76_24125 [Bacillus pseudomycoides]
MRKQKESKKDESLLDKLKNGVEDAYEDYSKIKDAGDDKIEIDGVIKVTILLFPKHWDRTQVLEAIHEAYNNKRRMSGKLDSSRTSTGMEIRFDLINCKIISAFPK